MEEKRLTGVRANKKLQIKIPIIRLFKNGNVIGYKKRYKDFLKEKDDNDVMMTKTRDFLTVIS